MKIITQLLLFALSFSVTSWAQSGKYTDKLKALYEAKAYEKVINFKASKESSMSAQSLYYKGMAHYERKAHKSAQNYFKQAIKVGPSNADMHFYNGICLYHIEQYDTAVMAFDEAIKINSKAPSYFEYKGDALVELELFEAALESYDEATQLSAYNLMIIFRQGTISMKIKAYDKAIQYFSKGLKRFEPKSDTYRKCSHQIGVAYQMKAQYDIAEKKLLAHLEKYPYDFEVMSSLIQIYYTLEQVDKTNDLKERIKSGYEGKLLPHGMTKGYCFDQFDLNEKHIMVFEAHNKDTSKSFLWQYDFIVEGEDDSSGFVMKTILDSANKVDFILTMVLDDTLYWYEQYVYTDSTDYFKVKNDVIEVIEKDIEPTDVTLNYEEWVKRLTTTPLGGSGESFAEAIIVGSVFEEYLWLYIKFPKHTFIGQRLEFHNGKPYDILTIKTKKGVRQDVYFDISSFFDK